MKYLYIIGRFQKPVLEDDDIASVDVIFSEDEESTDSGYLIPVFLAKLFSNFDGVRTEEIIMNPMDDPSLQYTVVRAMSKDKLVELRAQIPTNENASIRRAIHSELDLTPLYIGEKMTPDEGALYSAAATSEFIEDSYVRFIVYDSPHELRPPRKWDEVLDMEATKSRQSKAYPSLPSSEAFASFDVSPVVLCSPSFIKNFTFRVPPPPPTCAADDKEMWIMPNDWKIMTRIIDAEVNIVYNVSTSDNRSYVQWIPYLTTVGVQSDTVRAFLQESIDTFTSTDITLVPIHLLFRFPTSNPIMYPY